MATLFTNPFSQFFTDDNKALSGGKITFFEVGSTVTKKSTFSNFAGTIANVNPIILDQAGRIPTVFLDGSYRVTLQDKNDIQIDERDNVGGAVGGSFADWEVSIDYGVGGDNIVTGSDGCYYKSFVTPNIGNDPTSSATFWEKVQFVGDFNTNIDYIVGAIVRASDNHLYTSLVTPNQGNDPTSNADDWGPAAEDVPTFSTVVSYSIGDLVKTSIGIVFRSLTNSNLNNDPPADQTNWRFTGTTIWESTITYEVDDRVRGSDGNRYKAITGTNLNNDPTSSASNWSELVDVGVFNTNETYNIPDITSDSTGLMFRSLTNSNTGNTPISSPSDWATVSDSSAENPTLISGLVTSNGTDAAHDIDVQVGTAMNSTGATRMTLTSIFTKRIDATFATGTGNGGLASALTVANVTWYHVFLIITGGSADVIFDTSITCANGVANNSVTAFRRIASVFTDSAANIISYFQNGDVFLWDIPSRDQNATNPGTSVVPVTLRTPLAVQVEANISFGASDTGTNFAIITNSDQTDTAPLTTVATFNYLDSNTNPIAQPTNYRHFTNTSSQLRYRFNVSPAGMVVTIHTIGWRDLRGT